MEKDGNFFKLHNRLEMIDIIDNILISDNITSGDRLCVKNGKIGNNIKIEYKIGSSSENGEVYKIKLNGKNSSFDLALKTIPIVLESDLKLKFNIKTLLDQDSSLSEIVMHLLSNACVLSGLTCNLPFIYKFLLCDNCVYSNKNLSVQSGDDNCIYLLSELANLDLKQFLKINTFWTAEFTNCFLFQVINALYCLKKIFNISHNDLHSGNILIYKIKPGGYFKYTIDDNVYYIPNIGYLFVLWDFGSISSPSKIFNGETEKELSKFYTDIANIASIVKTEVKIQKGSIIDKIISSDHILSLKDQVKLFKNVFGKSTTSDNVKLEFNMNISLKSFKQSLPIELEKFVN